MPRWLVLSMLSLSALALLGYAGWWWITWPERTAREFLDLLVEGRLEEARRMIVEAGDSEDLFEWPDHDYNQVDWNLSKLEPLARGMTDVLHGHQRFGFRIGYQVEIERGRVLYPGLLFTGRLDGFGQVKLSIPDRTRSAEVSESSDLTPRSFCVACW